MKRLAAALILALLAFGATKSARAAENWKITNFHSDISITPGGLVDVSEKITADFGSAQKHGIFRTIPITYTSKDESLLYTSVNLQTVTQDGVAAIYSETNDKINNTVKIGDPNSLISGTHTYVLHYIVNGVLSSYDTYDELYWNVTGNGWDVPIDNASATVKLPTDGITQYSCYQGPQGSTEKCTYSVVSKSSGTFTASRILNTNDGLTVAVGYTKGMFPINVVSKPTDPRLSVTSLATQFIVTFLLSIAGVLLYTLRSRNKAKKAIAQDSAHAPGNLSTVAVEYSPPFSLRPGQIGGVIDEKVETLDITATIVDLAIRGYVTITEVPKTWALGSDDYTLAATGKALGDLRSYEQLLLTKLFKGRSRVKMSELKNTFYQDLAEVKDELYQDLVSGGYFVTNPQHVTNVYAGISIFLVITGGVMLAIGFYGIGVALIISAAVSLVLKKLIPERSLLGLQAVQKINGYKLFVSATEKYRQPYLENQNIFMEVLPYAIVFGVTAKLAKAFKDMGITPPQPTWYISNRPFVAFAFANQMNDFSNQLASNIASSPRSSGSGGSGFSGGGFGGGGGGSW